MSDSPPLPKDPPALDPLAEDRRKTVLPPDAALDRLIHECDQEILIAVAADPRLTEDLALALLQRRDLPGHALEQVHRNSAVAKLRKVQLAVVTHPRTPRHISIPTIRHLYTFELMQVALTPAVMADIKRAAEEALIGRLATMSSGERRTLAKRSSGRIAAALLLDKDEPIMQAALLNPQMTEMWIVKALKSGATTELLATAVCRHSKWVHRFEIKVALLANKHTPFASVTQIAADLPVHALKDVLRNAQLAPNVKAHLKEILGKRSGRA